MPLHFEVGTRKSLVEKQFAVLYWSLVISSFWRLIGIGLLIDLITHLKGWLLRGGTLFIRDHMGLVGIVWVRRRVHGSHTILLVCKKAEQHTILIAVLSSRRNNIYSLEYYCKWHSCYNERKESKLSTLLTQNQDDKSYEVAEGTGDHENSEADEDVLEVASEPDLHSGAALDLCGRVHPNSGEVGIGGNILEHFDLLDRIHEKVDLWIQSSF